MVAGRSGSKVSGDAVPDLDTRQLRAVLAVAENASFVAAAAQLRISQPALTRTIRRVEDVLGVALFERTTRRVALTPAGREFVAVAARLLNDLRIGARSLRELAEQQRGQVIIACIMSVAGGGLPAILARYRAAHPAVEIHLREGVHGTVLEDVRSGVADFGISYVDDVPPAFAAERLGREEFVAALPRRHPLAAHRAVALADLAAAPMISLPADSRTRRLLEGAAAQAGLALCHAVTVSQFATLLALVHAGAGAAVIPAGAAAAAQGVVLRPLAAPGLAHDLGILTLREREAAPAAAGMLALLRQAWPRD